MLHLECIKTFQLLTHRFPQKKLFDDSVQTWEVPAKCQDVLCGDQEKPGQPWGSTQPAGQAAPSLLPLAHRHPCTCNSRPPPAHSLPVVSRDLGTLPPSLGFHSGVCFPGPTCPCPQDAFKKAPVGRLQLFGFKHYFYPVTDPAPRHSCVHWLKAQHMLKYPEGVNLSLLRCSEGFLSSTNTEDS